MLLNREEKGAGECHRLKLVAIPLERYIQPSTIHSLFSVLEKKTCLFHPL